VLLLNRALSTEEGRPKAHWRAWEDFTQTVAEEVARARADAGRELLVFLWGRGAQRLAPAFRAGGGDRVRTLEWAHPSPLANNRLPPASRFGVACPHFREATEALAAAGTKLRWDPESRLVLACDGACRANGRPGAVAGCGVAAAGGALGGLRLGGPVAPRLYRLRDPDDPEAGLLADGEEAAPSNNRGEYLAGCWALLCALRAGNRGELEIVTDSRLFRTTLLEWLPARRRKGNADQLKNYDLVAAAAALLAEARRRYRRVDITHVRSHIKPPDREARPADYLRWALNDRADRIASAAVGASATSCEPAHFTHLLRL
jgi:ribonuclease HI